MAEFEWDAAKAAANRRKHGVGFEFATSAFRDMFSIEWLDDRGHHDEARMVPLGMAEGTLLVVVHVERRNRARLVSARRATRNEQDIYFRENGT
jgi:uncharacterized DUF497 family protein